MVTEESEKFISRKIDAENYYICIKENKELEDCRKIKLLEDVLAKDNTQEKIVLYYLQLKANETGVNVKDDLKYYEKCIKKKIFDENFGYLLEKTSAKEKIFNLIENIKNVIKINDIIEQLIKINQTIDFENIYFDPTFPVIYKLIKSYILIFYIIM